MALHKVTSKDVPEYGDLYALPLSEKALPKYEIPSGPSAPETVYQLIRAELLLDGNARQNLATFCTTWSEDEVHRLMDECLGKNMIDKDEYPQTAAIEERCVHILADLWNSPSGHDTTGCSTTGSSEAAMPGGLALKWRWRDRRRAEGKSTDRPNLVCGPVQVCWEKFARYFDVELRQIPLEPGATGMRPHQLRQYVDENTIGAAGERAGVTPRPPDAAAGDGPGRVPALKGGAHHARDQLSERRRAGHDRRTAAHRRGQGGRLHPQPR